MSVTAAELRKLGSLNLSPDQMAGVLDVLASRLEVEEAQRAAEAERKAAQAERKRRSRDKAVTVTGQSEEVTVTDDKKEKSPEPPKEKTTPPLARATPVPQSARLAFEAFNDLAREIGIPTAQNLTADRQTKIMARLNECGGLPGWADALNKVRGSPFLCGENDRGWKVSIDFILQKSSFTRLMEGSYDGSKRPQSARQNYSRADAFAVLDAVTDEAIRRADGHGPPCDEEDTRELSGLRKSAA